jgi:hypothetical protein
MLREEVKHLQAEALSRRDIIITFKRQLEIA